MGILLVVILRLLIPLTIFKWPFWGGLAALVLDFLDFNILNYFYPLGFAGYQNLDKILDSYYLLFELFVVSRWVNNQAKKISLGLFIYRIVGVILFGVTNSQKLLFLFPNLFEVFFLVYSGYLVFFKREPNLAKTTFRLILFALFIYKILLEFTLHVFDINDWVLKQLGWS